MDNQTTLPNFLTVAEVLDKAGGFIKTGSRLIKALAAVGTGNDSLEFFRERLKEIFSETKKDCEASKLIKAVENHAHCPVERWEGPLMRAKNLAGVEFDLPESHRQNLSMKPKSGNNIEDLILGGTLDDDGFDHDEDDDETLELLTKPGNKDEKPEPGDSGE